MRFEFWRRRFLKEMTFGPRACSTSSPVTEAPAGAVLRVPPVLLEQARARLDGTGLPLAAE